ncbi:prolyl aminopeptidase [Thalassotalea sp. M1531]|uniref:Proline iminopeptidase n=1 Tax=Thalassotalea algicola TaxID=2716224 RepID=A0A7Y0LHX8_9GAMM|nr:prolyl aminopeptidase [Thalassotalea algicola]NMP33580.1 prolyl aminopeptidase [Thalassotalea algicola]
MSRCLYPKIAPYFTDWITVDEHHQLYIEQSGNKDGIPVLYLHGGPGAGCSENYRRYFDPEKYRIVLIDQRGCGRSKPSPSLTHNTMWDLVNDLEKVRTHLNIDRWLVSGGSWGTTLALAYGISHPEKVLAFILRGVFLGSQQELDWLYQPEGAAKFFPEYYQEFIEPLSEEARKDPLSGYYQLLNSENELAMIAASQSWFLWELRLSTIEHHHLDKRHIEDKHQALCMAKISAHYFVNQCDLSPNYILEQISKIESIPATIIHGRYDMVCQIDVAYQLAKQWKNASLQILPYAGHSGFEQQTIDAFCKATDIMALFLEQ